MSDFNLSIEKTALLPALKKVVSSKFKTGNLTIITGGSYVDLVAPSSDMAIEARIEIDDLDDLLFNQVTVNAKHILNVCKLIPSGIINFYAHEDGLAIESCNSKFILNNTVDKADSVFKVVEPAEHCFFIKAGALKKALSKVILFMANNDVRYYLNGILIYINNDKIKIIASDGHRLSIYEDKLEQATGFEARIILPRKGVLELNRLLDDPEAELKVEFSSNNIRIFIKNLVFSAKLVDTKYPDFCKVLLQKVFFNKVHVEKQLLKNALTRVAILSNRIWCGVSVTIKNETLVIGCSNPLSGSAVEEIPVINMGAPLTIGLNAKYLLTALSNVDSDTVLLSIPNNLSSVIISEVEQCSYKFIVMPLKL